MLARKYFAYGTITLFGSTFQRTPLYVSPHIRAWKDTTRPLTTPILQRLPSFITDRIKTCVRLLTKISQERFRLFPFRSPLLREWTHTMNSYVRAISFSFPLGTEMFHFPRCPTCAYVFSAGQCGIPRIRFPH